MLTEQPRDAKANSRAAMAAAMADDNSYSLLAATGDLLVTGPARTNVMDLQIGLAGYPGKKGGPWLAASAEGFPPGRWHWPGGEPAIGF
jgi:hypothetical protein